MCRWNRLWIVDCTVPAGRGGGVDTKILFVTVKVFAFHLTSFHLFPLGQFTPTFNMNQHSTGLSTSLGQPVIQSIFECLPHFDIE